MQEAFSAGQMTRYPPPTSEIGSFIPLDHARANLFFAFAGISICRIESERDERAKEGRGKPTGSIAQKVEGGKRSRPSADPHRSIVSEKKGLPGPGIGRKDRRIGFCIPRFGVVRDTDRCLIQRVHANVPWQSRRAAQAIFSDHRQGCAASGLVHLRRQRIAIHRPLFPSARS